MKKILSLTLSIFAFNATAQTPIEVNEQIRGLDDCVGILKNTISDIADSDYTIILEKVKSKKINSEGYKISNEDQVISVQAQDNSGLRYGTLALAEAINRSESLSEIAGQLVNPTFDVRAIKFNLPWGAYRGSKSMDYHLSTCRDLDFWEKYLDMMQENRFNMLALYNMHPYHYMIKLDKYPEASPFTDEEVKEWNTFWKGLFKMAKDRGVEVYIVNWNIVIPEGLAKKHGLKVLNDTSQLVIDYTRESVRQVIDEYDDLAGIGVTLADWMVGMDAAKKEDWIADTFIAGMKEAKRQVKFMHRAVLSGSSDEMRRILDDADLPDPVSVEVKFNWSHGHSTPKLVITHASESGKINTGYWEPRPKNYKVQWMARNEDFFILRWGEPDFIREHIKLNTADYVNGYHIGSEGYIPAAEYFTKASVGKTWQYAFERQWLFYTLWGRLIYDSSTTDEFFAEKIEEKYPFANGKDMLDAYRVVSRMPLRLASYFKSSWDYTLYSEGFLAPFIRGAYDDKNSFFISIDELIAHDVLDPKYISISDFVDSQLKNEKTDEQLTSPLELADELSADAEKANQLLKQLRAKSQTYYVEYGQELDDITTWSLMSQYFADKLRAGVNLALFRRNGNIVDKQKAVESLTRCYEHWKQIIEITTRNYEEVPYVKGNSFGVQAGSLENFSWQLYESEVIRDITLAENSEVEE